MTRTPPTERRHPRSAAWARHGLEAWIRGALDDHREALRAARRAAPAIAAAARRAAAAWTSGGRWIFAGAGTSGRLAVQEAAECLPTFGMPARRAVGMIAGGRRALLRPVEGAEDDRASGARDLRRLAPSRRDLVVGITASGTTPYVHGVLVEGRRAGAATVLVTCGDPRRAPPAGIRILLHTGPEAVAGSTRLKAGTACKVALNHLTTGAMLLAGRVREGRMLFVRPASEKLRRRAIGIVADLAGVPEREARAALSRAGWSIPRTIEGLAPPRRSARF